jgi:RNA polymerase sigma factor (sigma-70 family)
LLKQLFNAVLKHARAIIWKRLHENDYELEDLAYDITSEAIKNLSLGRFDERSKFSTYVQGIAKNKINEELETRITRRGRFYVPQDKPEDDINLKDSKAESAFENVVQTVDLELLDHVAKELPPEAYCVWECWRDGMTMKATAEKSVRTD